MCRSSVEGALRLQGVRGILVVLLFLVTLPTVACAQGAQSLDVRLFYDVYGTQSVVLQGTFRAADFSAYPAFGLAVPAAALMAWQGEASFEPAYRMALAEGLAFVGTGIFKRVYANDRPYLTRDDVSSRANALDAWVIRHDPLSFPSGHAALSFALATSLSLSYPHWEVAVPAFVWASLVATSRVYLGLHYPSDVLAGAGLGAGVALGVHLLGDRLTPPAVRSEAGVMANPAIVRIRIPL